MGQVAGEALVFERCVAECYQHLPLTNGSWGLAVQFKWSWVCDVM